MPVTYYEDEREPYNIISRYIVRDSRLLTIRPECSLDGIDWDSYLNRGVILSAPIFSFFLLMVYISGGTNTYIAFVIEGC